MKKNLIVDIVAFVIYLIVANPLITGIALHEWLGIAVLIVFIVHCAFHVDWMMETLRNIRRNPSFAKTGNFVLDTLILLCFMGVTLSGIGISGDFLQAFGLYAGGYYFWNPLHSISAKVLLALLILHIVVHWKWIFKVVFKKKESGEQNLESKDG